MRQVARAQEQKFFASFFQKRRPSFFSVGGTCRMWDNLARIWPRRGPHAQYRNEDTALTLEQTAADRRFAMPFRPTYDYTGAFINAEHAAFATCPTREGMIDIGIDGWLLPADAMKLYELAYFCGGDCLELGTFRGLSTSVLLRASVAAGARHQILSIDLDPVAPDAGRATLAGMPGAERVHFFNTDGDEALASFRRAGRSFAFCFIDHSHRYEHVLSACRVLHHVLRRGAFCLFHDYNDQRNAMADCDDYGVWQGVNDGLDRRRFEFWGVFGCTGLFRRV
jgi:predicted O-methyltransferase YrrM